MTAYVEDGKLLVRAGHNQIALDQSLHLEFERTLEVFDKFISQNDLNKGK